MARTDLEILVATRTALLTALETYAGRPNYTVDGQTFDFNGLYDRLDKINAQISAIQGPVELQTEYST